MANEGKYSTFGKFVLGGYKFCYEKIRRLDRNRMIDHSDYLMCGTRDHDARDQSDDTKEYGFEVVLQPTVQELAVLMPIIGFTLSGGIYRPTDTSVSETTAKIDEVINVRAYTGVKVDKAIFQASRNSPLRLRLICLAKDASDGSSISESEVTNSADHFVFSQGVLALGGTNYYMSSMVYAIDNRLHREFNNSVTATNIDVTDLVQHVIVELPFNTEGKTIHDLLWGSSRIDGITGSATFTKSVSKSVAFAWDIMKAEGSNPDFNNRAELRQRHQFRVYDKTTGGDTDPSGKVTLVNS